ncbi:SH3 domain-binding protein 1 isoform X4 [Apteryx rowi]|uniref:SH3 domain-binding protein 1 isoform X4 n=1 Tax=Apteryx rowi TaxID=308060 RepID=UPI000E1D3CF0|nr:SH3 domain-binding protein 1 isoform X4 [Apteryx rowi]
MMKRQFHRMRQQLSHPNLTSRAQEATELLTEDLLQIEQRIEPAKRAAHSVSKRLQACLQGQCGSEMDKRVKKLPLMALSTTMAESFKELDTESSLGRALEMGCCMQSTLAKILAEFEITLERDVLQPLNKLSEEELPIILKRKKMLQKLISDWNAIKSRLNQAAKSSSNSTSTGTGPGASSSANKLENLKEEEEEVKRKLEQCKGAKDEVEGCSLLSLLPQDEYMADLYHFSTKEDSYASYFIRLMEIQAQYHRQSLGSLDSALAELKEAHSQTEPSFTADTPITGYYGVSLETHLKSLGREIALPIEACVMMLLASGMREEGLFRLAAGASVLRKLKSSLASGSNALEEFYADPHAVAGALKSYLRELPQPLMTFELYDEWVKVASFKDFDSRVQSLRDTCSRLPQENYNNLRYLIKFLAKLAEHQEVNKMTPSNIAIVLGPNLLWAQQSTGTKDPKTSSQPASPKVTKPSEAAGLLAPTPADDTTRKGKRPAPARPTVPPPPVAQPRSSAPTPVVPKQAAGPKALPRRMAGGPSRAPSVPPPLPPQPTRRQSHNGLQAPRPPASEASATTDTETATDCAPGAADEGQPLSPGGRSPPAASQPAGQASEND